MTDPSRRSFLKSSALASATLAVGQAAAQEDKAEAVKNAAHAGGSDVIRVGLIGCGGRGRGAGVQTLRADPGTKIVALADAFAEPMGTFLKVAGAIEDVKDRIEVGEENQYTGLDCHTKLLENEDVDLVILASPPGFRPSHYMASVAAGKHVFTEKPVAVDGPGLRLTQDANQMAKDKGLSVVSGLCWRYEQAMIDVIDQLREGVAGKLLAAESIRYSGLVGRREPRDASKTDFEHAVRNWFFRTWLSGDFCVEQFVHDLDMVCWALGEYPSSVICAGGRETREDDGNIFDHFAANFVFDSGVKYAASTRHQAGCENRYHNHVVGSKGVCDLMRFSIKGHDGERLHRGKGAPVPMHQAEHNFMYEALRKGEPLHNGDYMVDSTATGIMMREAAYTGKSVTREQVMTSQERLFPETYAWDSPVPTQPVATPGVTTLG